MKASTGAAVAIFVGVAVAACSHQWVPRRVYHVGGPSTIDGRVFLVPERALDEGLVGIYYSADSQRTLVLDPAGFFSYERRDDDMRVEANGDVSFRGSGLSVGMWRLTSSSEIEFEPAKYLKRPRVRIRMSPSGTIEISEPLELLPTFDDVPRSERWLRRAKKKPNKAPEPTPTSVTSPAVQEPRQL